MTATTLPASLAAALAAVQASLPDVAKDQVAKVEKKAGGFYKYSYADLASVTRVILPRLGAVGLSWTTKPTMLDGKFVLEYKLLHVSGECEVGIYPLPDRGSPQEIGSAITYARRYALCSVTGVAPDDDDDAAEATAGHRRDQQPGRQAGNDSWESARPAETANQDRERANALRDWALKSERTSEDLRPALTKLKAEHPERAQTIVINEHGDDEELAQLLQRRIHDLGDQAAKPAEQSVPAAADVDPGAAEASPPPPPADTAGPAMVTDQQHRHMHVLWREVGFPGDENREQRLIVINRVVGRTEGQLMTTSKDLTSAEADQVIATLKARRDAMQRQPEGANA